MTGESGFDKVYHYIGEDITNNIIPYIVKYSKRRNGIARRPCRIPKTIIVL